MQHEVWERGYVINKDNGDKMAAEGAARLRAQLQARSRARARRRRRRDHLSSSSEEEEEEERSEEDPQIYERQFFWTCYRESGFPNRVNHAVAAHRDADGSYYLYSVGGYHADDDERTVVQADMAGGPFFKSSPIDIHCLDVGKCTRTVLVNEGRWRRDNRFVLLIEVF